MSQAYTKYNGKAALKTKLDVKYPKNFAQAKVNGSTSASIGWAPSGKGKYDYNVVAIYNDDDFAGAKHITYALAFHDGQPVALVDQATNGGPDFYPTQNASVRDAFDRIANGTSATSGSTSTSANSSSSASSSVTSDLTSDGRNGYFATPSATRGTWYFVNDNQSVTKVTITDHELTTTIEDGSSSTTVLYNRQSDYQIPQNPSQDLQFKSMDWSEGNAFTHNGIQYFSVRSWLQETAPHNYYGVTTEKVNGQDTRVLLLAEGGHVQVQEVGYPTEQLAKDNVDTKFDNLDYQ